MILLFIVNIFITFLRAAAEDKTEDSKSNVQEVCVGIDLGTTYSCVSIVPKTGAADIDILDLGAGKTTLPSVVRYEPVKTGAKEKVTYVAKTGWEVYTSNMKNPTPNTYLYAFKRYMGISSISDEPRLQGIHEKVTYSLVEKDSGDGSSQKSIYMQIKDINGQVVKNVSAIDASAYILEHLMEIVNEKYGTANIANVIITVPAYFSEVQVQATKTSATIAKLKLQRTVNEPVAAAYAYQIKNKPKNENIESYLVFDFGGGTLDVSILEYESGVLEVVTYSGSNFLGGENINDCLYKHFRKILKDKNVMLDDVELLRLRGFAEKFKISLCNKQNDEPDLDVLHSQDFAYLGDKVETFTMKSSEFKKICAPIIADIQEQLTGKDVGVLYKYKSKWGKDKNDIEKVLLVGGSTRVPFIQDMLSDIFGRKKVSSELNPDTSVAEGAALYAANMLDWLKDDSVHLIDVVPMNIGICVDSDTFESILDMESAIPATQVKTFTTGQDNQTMVKIKVAQGVRYQYHKNQHLGQFELSLKDPKPRGVPQIEVSISINKEREISVKAVDKATGLEEKIKFVKHDYELSETRRNEMLRDRENNKSADEKLKQKDSKIKELETFKDMVNSTAQKSEVQENVRTDIYKAITKVEDFLKDAKNPMSGISHEDVSLRHKEFEREVAPLMGVSEAPKEKGEPVADEKAREEL